MVDRTAATPEVEPMSLKDLLGPPKPRPLCRWCDMAPALPGSLYCSDCQRDNDSFMGMIHRQRHPIGCFCLECQCIDQRAFRIKRAAEERTRRLKLVPPDPDLPPPPRSA